MKKNKKSILSAFLALMLLSLTILPGCAKEPPTLHVVIEDRAGWWNIINDVAKEFMKAHQGVNIVVEKLPAEEDTRVLVLEQIRAAIMSGKGPDIFLLPCDVSLDEPLFPDVAQAMRNGLFADLSEYYDADTALGKDNLIPAVMDAGVVDGGRYVLPLRYNLPKYPKMPDNNVAIYMADYIL